MARALSEDFLFRVLMAADEGASVRQAAARCIGVSSIVPWIASEDWRVVAPTTRRRPCSRLDDRAGFVRLGY